ncbi:MAG: AI-2E family transporter [Patescibacteria group bacterium]|nr:AI-2E family transporter [Patescibacteria group bacterium]MDE2438842.1 AI-2E family transporter [Patescibacteria group bacterium]
MPTPTKLDITWKSLLRILIMSAGVFLIFKLSNILTLIVFAVVLASALNPIATYFSSRGWPRIFVVLALYILIFSILGAAIYYLSPLIFSELRSFVALVGGSQSPVLQGYGNITYLITFLQHLESISSQDITILFSRIGSLVASLFGGFTSMLVVIVITFYLLLYERSLGDFIADIVPVQYEAYVLNVWNRTQRRIGRWLRAQVLLSAVMGILVFFGLSILGLDNALLLAVLSAFFEIVPIVGPIMAGAAATLATLNTSPTLALYVILMFIGIQQFESHVLISLVMKKAVGLNPIFVITLLLAGAELGGVIWVFLAIPVGVLLEEIVHDMVEKKRRV